ncbi:hypothetical protein EJ07DRAFT_177542 [Lizonia empirigonia]|nr:hypothetical protein EJ07DRAFT_177542 [Lizonia empirigonia]
MSLNKRTGLYTMPSHHLHGANPTTWPTFNSMDFAAAEAESPRTKGGPVQPGKESKSANHTPQEKKAKKKKKKNSVSAYEDQQTNGLTPATSTPLIKATPATGSSKGKSKAKNSDDKSDAQSGKKRKRDSQGDVELPKMTQRLPGSGSFVVGADMLQNVQTCVKAACDVFRGHAATTVPVEQPSKKKTKAVRKSNDIVDFDRMAEETQNIDKAARKKRKKEKRRSASAGLGRPATANPASVPSAPIMSSPARKTPVPLPVKAPSNAVNTLKAYRIGRKDSRFLVLDTPPSQLSKTPVRLPDSPIPFKLPDATKPAGWAKTEKVVEMSPPTPVVDEAPSSAPPALNKHHRLEVKRGGRVSLTASNLMRYTQPLNDKSRSRPLSRAASAAASTAGSTTSGRTTPSIKDLFARVGKPYSRSGAEIDPFVVPEIKKKTFRESHDEASTKEFTERYRAVQKAVNFTDEREYLDQAVAWRMANDALGPLPCLGIKASGCNSKREKVLRLSKDDASSPVKALVTTEAEHAALLDAKQRAAEAERFLARAVAARVPVPLGQLEGVWKLFCPAYSELHVDKYAYGQRTLTIFSLAGFKTQDAISYTARLSIPPRSMLFSMLSFSAPPHASFRATRVRTAAEGYAMEMVFLGNGYLLLRLDLGLLLSGKPALMRGGRRVLMEFVGVHESAVVWRAEQDELEVVGRRLFAKYDGEG